MSEYANIKYKLINGFGEVITDSFEYALSWWQKNKYNPDPDEKAKCVVRVTEELIFNND